MDAPSSSDSPRKWQALNSGQRRVLGVLIEKAKTTPDAYPMTVNAIITGCNQKTNREPLMSLTQDDVEQILDELRGLSVVAEIHGSGRVPKYRHYAYEWLGVDKTELAVMTELLLRGEQALGDLRGRAARMEPIADVASLMPIVKGLVAKGLMVELTPAGRGQIVSHNLYKEREIVELRTKFANYVPPSHSDEAPVSAPQPTRSVAAASPAIASPQPLAMNNFVTRDMFNELEVEVAELRAEMARVRETLRMLGGPSSDSST